MVQLFIICLRCDTLTSGISPIGDNEGIYGIMSSFTKPFDDLEGVTNRPAAQQWAVCTP